ncbi:MAG: hypothetical protein IPL61_20740 [Myxococcales bacterium]|nr:hypothetical protein [Myxococcales bacterium]
MMTTRAQLGGPLLAVLGAAAAASGCGESADAGAVGAADRVIVERYDPLAVAQARAGAVDNLDAAIPPMCFTRTDGTSNPCWVCHTDGRGRTRFDDGERQATYAFPERARTNPWRNLFVDRRAAIAAIDDATILAWVRADNYQPLVAALARAPASYPGFRPDLDLGRGFDADGLARDGSGWRAVRFQPFPGAFWPTNGSTSDLFIRLPARFRGDPDPARARAIYRLNLALVEAAVTAPTSTGAVDREVEAIDERLLGFDLDGDGALGAATTRIRRLPPAYAGAPDVAVVAQAYPPGAELLHSVRYLDPDAPTAMATRMKELRYARKVEQLDDWGLARAYAAVADEQSEGTAPRYQGDAQVGFLNGFGWQYQGFIEDAGGRLRLQTDEEHRACLGCHGAIGVTVDHGFAFARKVPGAAGWRPQDLRGLVDRPQLGHAAPEIATYFRRVGGGDETRANDELLARFFPDGALDERALARAAVGGDRDLAWLLTPSRARALALDKAYLAVVREQSFGRGRDAVLRPATRVHAEVRDDDTGLDASGRIYRDARLLLTW